MTLGTRVIASSKPEHSSTESELVRGRPQESALALARGRELYIKACCLALQLRPPIQ
ncbi:MAG: hypothetical protein ACI841_001272 [Planctomycetota bacterium]|jgi:hypothetical protein